MTPSTHHPKFPRRKLLGILAVSALTGCASTPPPPTTTGTLREYVEAHQNARLAVIDKLLTKNNIQQKDGFILETLKWCMDNEEVRQYEKDLEAYCENKGGNMTQRYFCVDSEDKVIFMAKVSELHPCNQTLQSNFIETIIIEPTQPTLTPSYLNEVVDHGFKSKFEIAADNAYYQAMELASQLQHQDDQRQHQNDLPLITRPGTPVCTKQGGKIVYAWVEDYAAPNLKLRIYAWGAAGSRNIFTYSSEQIIWAPHFDWNLCE